ncbi:hypothetical protein ACROYT_G015755 [Oculina patagonica]
MCLGVPDHSSDPKERETTEEESEDRFSQFLLDLYNKRINESEWKEEETSGDIGEFDSEGDLSVRTSRNFCRRLTMKIEFSKLFGKTNPYILPERFNAYRCSGECPYPIPAHMNPTTHAVIQRLMRDTDKNKKWPAPCCVPTTLKPISVLYLDHDNKVQHKEMQNMVVEKCGCR